MRKVKPGSPESLLMRGHFSDGGGVGAPMERTAPANFKVQSNPSNHYTTMKRDMGGQIGARRQQPNPGNYKTGGHVKEKGGACITISLGMGHHEGHKKHEPEHHNKGAHVGKTHARHRDAGGAMQRETDLNYHRNDVAKYPKAVDKEHSFKKFSKGGFVGEERTHPGKYHAAGEQRRDSANPNDAGHFSHKPSTGRVKRAMGGVGKERKDYPNT